MISVNNTLPNRWAQSKVEPQVHSTGVNNDVLERLAEYKISVFIYVAATGLMLKDEFISSTSSLFLSFNKQKPDYSYYRDLSKGIDITREIHFKIKLVSGKNL